MMTDPVADMLTRIRNAVANERPFVDMPFSREKLAIAGVLQREGYVWESEVIEGTPRNTLRISLKYGPSGERVIQQIKRVSKPGNRVYSGVEGLPNVLQGLGIAIVSTSKGVLSNREAKSQRLGGEVLCTVW
ncbi:MAG: 30S ribosomal protein S8 [Planctomyces sp.]|nr:30S ribosomal protein S8 [Planctomyces sp.]